MKRYRILFISLLGILAPLIATAQSLEELYKDAEFFYFREDYEESAYLFRQLSKVEPDNYNVHFMLGMSYLYIPGEEEKAIPCFLKAVENINLKHKANRYSEKKAPHHAWYYLGDAYAVTNQLDLALDAYESFRSLKNFEKKYNVRIAEDRIKAVERAKIIQDAPLDLKLNCLPEPINTTKSDYSAVISANEKMMVWVSSQRFYEAILMSVKDYDEWSEPINITPQVMSDGDLFPTGLSWDGTELLLVKRGTLDSDIYYSKFDGTLWSKAVPVKGYINSNFVEDHASFSPDGNRIYFSSARRGSYGGLDIYYSDRMPDGNWDIPVNLGNLINTPYDETSAYVSPDGNTLIFSSKGHFNMGGYDLFSSILTQSGTWTSPTNIGFPINTTKDNLHFVPLKDGKTGLYTQFTNDCVGKEDLWFVEIIPYEKALLESLQYKLSLKNFTINISDDEGETIILDYDNVADSISVRSASGKHYRVTYSRDE
ncbi:MAG TPA: hypothetical protein ENN61_03325 [Bacteroidaceae bacterium]|nr:hypothetical protein [Bacteroidaceae bacterium]